MPDLKRGQQLQATGPAALGSILVLTATLPFSAYSDPSTLRIERERLFARSWQYAGNITDLPAGGSAHPTEINGLPIVLTRAEDDQVHALVNVCAHRGSIVCDEAGPSGSLTCPYHAWRYDLDGTLRVAPRSERETGFDPSTHRLEALPVGQWGPFLFVAPDSGALPFEEFLGELPKLVEESGVDVDSLVFHSRVDSELSANWKVCVENFLECYHCRVAHPDFSRAVDTSPDGYELVAAPTFSTQLGPVRETWSGSFNPIGEVERAQFHLLFPNTVVNIMPGRPNLSIGPIIPVTATTTHRFLDYFFGPDVPENWMSSMIEFDDQVGREDTVLVELMQRGLTARPDRRGTLFVDSERLIAHFNEYLTSTMG